MCNGIFGFDPARNHYPNDGNTSISYTCDQIGVVARSLDDIIEYDKAIMGARHGADVLHGKFAQKWRGASEPATVIRVGFPKLPFVDYPPMPPEWREAEAASGRIKFTLHETVRMKWEAVRKALLSPKVTSE